MQFKPIMDVIERIRLMLSPSVGQYKIRPTIEANGPVIYVEVPPTSLRRAEIVLPIRMDGIDIVVISSLL